MSETNNEATKMPLLATIYKVFGNTHYFSTKKNFPNKDKDTLTNAYILAAKKKMPEVIKFSLDDIPIIFQKEFHALLQSHQVIHEKLIKKHKVISDNGNIFSVLFAKQYMRERKKLVSNTPSRILIN